MIVKKDSNCLLLASCYVRYAITTKNFTVLANGTICKLQL